MHTASFHFFSHSLRFSAFSIQLCLCSAYALRWHSLEQYFCEPHLEHVESLMFSSFPHPAQTLGTELAGSKAMLMAYNLLGSEIVQTCVPDELNFSC
mmetsp:Transcript_5/g.8  ORF Transcript_5/g.8 Transcript_5/m.8 type:complete len:97 (+) Transcript_5:270-560(+)